MPCWTLTLPVLSRAASQGCGAGTGRLLEGAGVRECAGAVTGPCQIVLDGEGRAGSVDECAAIGLREGASARPGGGPGIGQSPAVQQLGVVGVDGQADCNVPWAMVVPAPSIVPPVQTVAPVTVKVPGPVRSPLDSFSVPVLALPSNSIVPPSMVGGAREAVGCAGCDP